VARGCRGSSAGSSSGSPSRARANGRRARASVRDYPAPMTLRVAFLGNDPWSVPSLDAIAAEPELSLALVVTNPPKEAGRGAALTPTSVAKAATAHGVPMLEVGGVLDGPGATALAKAAPDVIVVVAYGH